MRKKNIYPSQENKENQETLFLLYTEILKKICIPFLISSVHWLVNMHRFLTEVTDNIKMKTERDENE